MCITSLRWGCVNRAKDAVREEMVDLEVDTFAAHDEDEYSVVLSIEELWQLICENSPSISMGGTDTVRTTELSLLSLAWTKIRES